MSDLYRRAELMVSREIHACLSSLVSTLSSGYGNILTSAQSGQDTLNTLAEQALDLTVPISDYEEAGKQEGWVWNEARGMFILEPDTAAHRLEGGKCDWQALCEARGIEPYEWEVYEHWAVSSWLGKALEAAGERVDHDFAGMVVWARTTTGQAIAMDSVIERIVTQSGYAEHITKEGV